MTNTTTTPKTQYNVIADSRKGNPDETVVVGAHLDSVEEGPGINDNGSGSSSLIEIAEQISKLKLKPKRRLRFAFWGAEEAGLIGSTAYVNSLPEADAQPDPVEPQLRHGRFAELRALRLRREQVRHAAAGR